MIFSGTIFGEAMRHWTEPEVAAAKIEEAYALLHNALLLGDQTLHSMANADLIQAKRFKASGTIMSLPEARDIVHGILMKWVGIEVGNQSCSRGFNGEV